MSFLPDQPKIIIIGAGIAGLTTALALNAAGFSNIHIFEAASHLTALGVGINLQPSAALILRNLGLLEALEKLGIQTQDINFYNRHGNIIISEPRGRQAGYLVPQLSIHRGELQMLLLASVMERLGKTCIYLGHALSGFDQTESTITAHFTLRKSDPPKALDVVGNLLIAADGINSSVRKLLYPTEGPPRFSGRMLWRGCLEREPYLTGASMVWAGHADQKFIAYPISQRSSEKGRSLVNWIAELRTRTIEQLEKDTTPPKSDWTKTVDKSVFQGPFEKWKCGGLEMKDLIDKTEKVFEFPMSDRDPVDQWTFGRVTLLGDAAHAMYPIGSNGASQAIIDADCIAKCLVSSPNNYTEALVRYQEERLPATAKIVRANRANGPDLVLQLAEERAPDGFENINDVIPQAELEGIGLTYKAVAGSERCSVNGRAKETDGVAKALGLSSPLTWL